MNRYQSAVVVFFVSGIIGCAGIFPEPKEKGATVLEECPKDMNIALSDKGAILTSIVVHAADESNTWFFLLKEEATRSKYRLSLKPRSRFLGIHKEGFFSYKSKPRSYCYVVPPGHYQFVIAYTYHGRRNLPPRLIELDLTKGFQVQAGKVSYIGQLFIEDPQLKGKGYFGHVLTFVLNIFEREELEITSLDESDDDIAWLEEHTQTTKTSVINAVEF